MRKSSESFAGLPLHAISSPRQTCALNNNKKSNRGMTLLELLIVVSLLSIVALASVSLIVDTGEWKQQQVTEDQWLSIKRAIVGDDIVDANDRREYAGFVTDMGRLPNCLRELIRPFDCTADLNAANKLAIFSQDMDSNQWSGWRGPYLGVPGANEYRDGWRNTGRDDNTGNDDDVNYGWLFGTGAANGTACQDAVVEQMQPGTIIIQSCGDDGDVDNTETGFPADYPYVEFDSLNNPVYIPSVTRHDYQVDLGAGWNSVPVKLKAATAGSSTIIPADSLRLRINYPVGNGRIPDWIDALIDTSEKRDNAPFLSATFPDRDTKLVDATGVTYIDGATVTVPAGSTLSDTTITAPDGDVVFTNGSDISYIALHHCPCELTINAGTLTTNGPPTVETLNGATTIAIKPEYIAPITADLGKYMIELSQATIGSGTSFTLPNGATLTLNAAADDAYFPKLVLSDTAGLPTVTVSAAFTLEGDLVETDASGDQFIVPSTSTVAGNVITIAKTAPTIPKGLRNITIVCEADGFLFDGDCSDNAATYTPIATPYQLNVSPRSYIPLPDEIVWNIP